MLRSLCIVTMIALAAPRAAHAHAVLLRASPAAHGTVKPGTLHVELQFNSRIDGPRCALTLLTSDGKTEPLPLERQPAPDSLAAYAPGLHSGNYTLRWQALASDGHITRGQIPFHVQP